MTDTIESAFPVATTTTTEVSLPLPELDLETTASWMAREWQAATAEIRAAMTAIHRAGDRLKTAFAPDDNYRDFQIDYDYSGERGSFDRLEGIITKMQRQAWRALVVKLGILPIMSVKEREKLEHDIEKGEVPPITEEAVTGVLLSLASRAKDFAAGAAKEVFEILKPRGQWAERYKTNTADDFRVGRKVILPWYVEPGWSAGKFRVNYNRQKELTAIDSVFHLLDGKGVLRDHIGPLSRAIEETAGGVGQTDYFEFRAYKNRNLHLTMRRLDLVKELNRQASGDYVLGRDMK